LPLLKFQPSYNNSNKIQQSSQDYTYFITKTSLRALLRCTQVQWTYVKYTIQKIIEISICGPYIAMELVTKQSVSRNHVVYWHDRR